MLVENAEFQEMMERVREAEKRGHSEAVRQLLEILFGRGPEGMIAIALQ